MDHPKTPRLVFNATILAASVAVTYCNAWAQQPNINIGAPPGSGNFSAPSQNEMEAHRLRGWERWLTALARQEKANLFVDIPSATEAPLSPMATAHGEDGMRVVAACINRNWTQVNGIQTFSRIGNAWNNQRTEEQVVAWLSGLDDKTLKEALLGSISVAVTDPAALPTLTAFASANPGVGLAMADNASGARLSVRAVPRFFYSDPKTGAMRDFTAPSAMRSAGQSIQKPANPGAKLEPQVKKLGEASTGPLDFGTGKVMKLSEIVAAARKAYGAEYFWDARTRDNLYFINGKYDKAGFDKVLETLTQVPGARPATPGPDTRQAIADLKARIKGLVGAKLDVSDLRDMVQVSGSADRDALNAKYGASEALDSAPFFDGAAGVQAGALTNGNPGLGAFFQSVGITDNMTLSLGMDLLVGVGCSGMHDASAGWNNGDWQQSHNANLTLIILKRW